MRFLSGNPDMPESAARAFGIFMLGDGHGAIQAAKLTSYKLLAPESYLDHRYHKYELLLRMIHRVWRFKYYHGSIAPTDWKCCYHPDLALIKSRIEDPNYVGPL